MAYLQRVPFSTTPGHPNVKRYPTTPSILLLLVVVTTANASDGAKYGVGLNAMSRYVDRDTKRAGASVQPSAWVELPAAGTLASAWTSWSVENLRFDEAAVDLRIGRRFADVTWFGVASRGRLLRLTRQDSAIVEFGFHFTWFNPPYRPTAVLAYDLAGGRGWQALISIPYTVRLAFFPPTTFIPEGGFRVQILEDNRFRAPYLSFTALIEKRWGNLAIVPLISVIPVAIDDENSRYGGWLVWGGLHLGFAP